jgi:hypothetical protein
MRRLESQLDPLALENLPILFGECLVGALFRPGGHHNEPGRQRSDEFVGCPQRRDADEDDRHQNESREVAVGRRSDKRHPDPLARPAFCARRAERVVTCRLRVVLQDDGSLETRSLRVNGPGVP